MRTHFTIFFLLLFQFVTLSGFAQSIEVTSADALNIAHQSFKDRDVDYYLVPDSTNWIIFVDALPYANWMHECYLLTIPKVTCQTLDEIVPEIEERDRPPYTDMIDLDVKKRFDPNTYKRQVYKKKTRANVQLQRANTTFALILSGGHDKKMNYERYWNDCSFIYHTLVDNYLVPRNHIKVIISDGDDPAPDMKTVSGEFISSPLDLDGDGNDDINYAATKSNVKKALSELSIEMQPDDQLFVFVVDHGGSKDTKLGKSYIALWGQEELSDEELADYLLPSINKGVSVNVVLGQCYSGGFTDDLAEIGCVVTAACAANEVSNAMDSIPYDEFVYNWTCAVNGSTPTGTIVDADIDKDEFITMDEAFDYAEKTKHKNETPQFDDGILGYGVQLALNKLPCTDVFMKDEPLDSGLEPNTNTEIFWNSPSICVVNGSDGYVIDDTNFESLEKSGYFYIRVYNLGNKPWFLRNKYLTVYYAIASTTLTSDVLLGNINYEGQPLGGMLTQINLGTVPPRSYKDIKIDVPDSVRKTLFSTINAQLNIYASITDPVIPISGFYANPLTSKNSAQKSLVFIDKKKGVAIIFYHGSKPSFICRSLFSAANS